MVENYFDKILVNHKEMSDEELFKLIFKEKHTNNNEEFKEEALKSKYWKDVALRLGDYLLINHKVEGKVLEKREAKKALGDKWISEMKKELGIKED